MADAGSFERFTEVARAAVEEEARTHSDDRWWILEPLLVTERTEVRVLPLARADSHALRVLRDPGLAELPRALGARRAAVALHADLEIEGEPVAAIVLVILGGIAQAYEYARVERTALGTPRLGPWEPSDVIEADVAAALARTVGV
jgi:hypothetical protein